PLRGASMRFGFVTYLWGQDMKLPELIQSCEESGLLGVEARTGHAHGIEPRLSASQRNEVKKQFEDSPVRLVGYGSNCQFHDAEPEKLRSNIDQAKAYIQLMHDCGGTGVKVKPNGFVPGIEKERTIEQMGRSLNEIAAYGDDYGQEIRVEVHGSGTSDLPVIKAIFDIANHPNVKVCWNSNPQDLLGMGLEANFNLVQSRFGATVHVRELDSKDYPYTSLIQLLYKMNYSGWILLEARTNPANKIQAMKDQKALFDRYLAEAMTKDPISGGNKNSARI
ncbi:MAG: sugar phosphate isomerase/epimerase, partial [Verrucomicrobia bacterium]|nr:sugar phosphate isomerase/epimerase [Verrucomicrobiota bacterium]